MKEAGHYYTVYYVSLAVGFEPEIAFRNAFFAQMPDEVEEFDATNVAIGAVEPAVGYLLVPDNSLYKNTLRGAKEHKNRVMVTIQQGFHCLTGGDSKKETAYRKAIATGGEYLAGSPAFGLNLHAFGDSYAHRVIGNQGVLYSTGPGHLMDMHKPDQIYRRKDLYIEYVENLWDILWDSMQAGPTLHRQKKSATRETLLSIVNEVQIKRRRFYAFPSFKDSIEYVQRNGIDTTWDGAEEHICDRIRESAEKILNVRMKKYAPEDKSAVSLRDFQEENLGKYYNDRIIEDKIRNIARDFEKGER